MKRLALLLLLGSIAAGCAGRGAPLPVSPAPAAGPDYEIVWVKDSAEYRVAVIQAYWVAIRQVERLAAGREAGSWAVMMDVDETLLSNLDYSVARARVGGRYTAETWADWVEAESATAIPGAIAFVDHVRGLGGRVAVVTNRSQEHCEATRRNLVAVGVRFDHLRCQDGESDKGPRWEEVRTGVGTGLGPLEIVMWVGDNILDFPGMDQSARSAPVEALADFGNRFILLPNPLYGSWEQR